MPLILPRPPWPIVNETATDAPTRQLTVAAENTPIPILYGEDQLGARLLAVKVDETNNRVVMSLGWCLGEIEGIDQIYFDGTPAPAGVTFTHYLGTPSQGIDPTLQGAIAGYSDTNVITVGGVNVGTAYTVAVIPKGVKVPRNITADIRGLKLYDSRQNRIRQSETYSNAAWGKTRVTVSSPGGNAPTGAAITKLAETTGSGTHLISITESASASTAYRASIWIQAAGRDKGRFTLDGESIDFDLTAVTAGAGHIVAEGNAWHRIDIKATTGGTASTISYQINILNDAGNDSYTGDGSSGFNLGGSLIVQSTESYPYIKTTTAHITPATAYSTNPALVLADFYASTVYGKGQTPNYGSAAKCAVANDESVGGSARRSIGLAIERIASVEQWIETIRTYAACFIDPSGDKPTLIPDRPAPTRRTLTESDIVENSFRLTRRSGRDVPTVVTVIYTDKTVTPYRDAEATAKVSGVDTGTVQRREITLRLPGISNHEQAYREAVEQLNALRLIAEDVEFETYDDAIADQIGDIIALNITNPIPISGDLYRIMAAEPVHGSGSAWRISAAAHTDLIYSDEVQAGSHVNDTVMPDASTIDGPTSLNATSSTEINIDGTPITALNVTWTAATSIYVDRYQIEHKRSSDTDWQRADTQNTNFSIKPVIPAISYDIRVRTASQLVGIYSAWVSLTISATGKGDIPAAPSSLATTDTFYGIVLTWTNPAINDLAHIEIWRSADNNRANAIHINDVIGTSYTDGNVGGTAYYWIRAVNTSEIASDWHPTSATGGVSGTKTTLDSAAADTTAPTDPGSLNLTTGVEEAALFVIAWVKATWSGSTDDGILSGYQVQYWTSEDATKVSTFSPTGTTEYRIVPVKPGLTVSMRVRAEDWAGNVSNWTVTETVVVAGDTVVPAKPTGVSITAGIQKVIVDWVNPTDDDFLETEVYISTTSGFTPGPTNLRFTGRGTRFVWDGGTIGQNYYAKLQARDVTGNPSGYTTVVGPAAPFNVRTVDLEDALLTIAKFASGIRPVEIVGALPAAGNQGRIVLLTTDNKLYRDTGTVWTTDIPASDVTGQLTDAQIAAISAAKLTGQITETQITDDAITTPKLAAGAVTANELAAASVVAGKIAAGVVTASEVAANTLTAGQIAAGAISSSELAANAVVAGKIATDTIVAGDGVIATAAIQNAQIDTVDAAKITTGSLDANRIAAGSITAGKLSVSQLSAIAADLGTVTAGILQGAIVRTAASGARVQLNSTNGIEVFNSGGTRTVHLNKDGSGYVGSAGALSWNTTGTVTIPGSLIAGEIVGNTIKTAVSGWRVTLNESGIPIRYWDGTNTHFSVDTSGNVDAKQITIRDANGTILLQSGGNLDWGRIAGSGKPVDNATKNVLYRQTTAPAGTSGDIWFDTDDNLLYRHSGSAWEVIGNGYDNTSQLADGAGLGQTAIWTSVTGSGKPVDNATKNTIYRQTGAPAGTNGDIWFDTDDVILYRHNGTAWERVGNDFADTAQLADGAGLGNTAIWSSVTGTGKPADNATRNTLTVSSSAPGSPVNGDLWYDSGNAQWKVRSGGAWTIASDITAQKTAAAIAGQGAFATLNQITSTNVSTYIANAAILNAQIGNIIQASALASDGQPTWKLDKTGAIDARSITIRDSDGYIILQSGGSLDYTRVAGTKPPANATYGADASNLAAGTSANQIPNSDFSLGLDGWEIFTQHSGTLGRNTPGWIIGRGTAYVYQGNTTTTGESVVYNPVHVPVSVWTWYELSAYTGAHRCRGFLRIEWYDANKSFIGFSSNSTFNDDEKSGGISINDYKRLHVIAEAPANTAYARITLVKEGTKSGSDSFFFFTRIHFAEARAAQTVPSPWSASPPLLDQMTASNISTYIASAAIGNAQIGNAAVGTLTIAGEAVTVPRHYVNNAEISVLLSKTSTDTGWITIASVSNVDSGGGSVGLWVGVKQRENAYRTEYLDDGTVTFESRFLRTSTVLNSWVDRSHTWTIDSAGAPTSAPGGLSYRTHIYRDAAPPAGNQHYYYQVRITSAPVASGDEIWGEIKASLRSLFVLGTKR